MRSYAKAVYGVTLVVEGENRVLVDVIGGHDHQGGEPLHVVSLGDADKGVAGNARQIGQIAGVDANAQRAIAQVVQGHRNAGKVQQTTP